MREVYTTEGGAGYGTTVKVPVYTDCESENSLMAPVLSTAAYTPDGEVAMDREKWKPVLRPVPDELVVLPSGTAFDLRKIPDPWFLERPLVFGDDPEAPIGNQLYISAPVEALGLAGETLSPAAAV